MSYSTLLPRPTSQYIHHLPLYSNSIQDFICNFVSPTDLSIILQSHVSKASNFLISSFLKVQVSEPYRSVVHTKVLTILILACFFKPFVSNSFLLLNASFACTILRLLLFPIFHRLLLCILPFPCFVHLI